MKHFDISKRYTLLMRNRLQALSKPGNMVYSEKDSRIRILRNIYIEKSRDLWD